jgi:D-glycero-alpha-D-manno-heptose-7-phosphate kinase
MIIARTPFRISFFGGGTDFPEYYTQHGGAVLATTIDQYCYLSIHKLSPFFKHRFRASYAQTESVLKPEDFQHPLVRECLLHLGVQEGVEISHVADLPGRTGLGTSSSFTVGLLNALHIWRGERVTAEDLAREAIHVERVRVGDTGGHQDQYVAAYGGFLRLDFSAGPRTAVRRLALPAARLLELEQCLMLFYTGIEQSAEGILTSQRQRTGENLPYLKQMRDMVDEAERILIDGQDVALFGQLLHHTWELKKKLAAGISNTAVDLAYATARKHGALGGKLLGAGGRGFLLLFAPAERHAGLRKALPELQNVPFRFSSCGSEIIFR